MKKKLITALALIFPAAVLLLWTGSLQYRLLTAPGMRLIVEGYDPRDIFSGHYIRLTPRFDQSGCGASVEWNLPRSPFQKQLQLLYRRRHCPAAGTADMEPLAAYGA